MQARDRIFMENDTVEEMMKQHNLAKYEGHWHIAILVPHDVAALDAMTSIYTVMTWLKEYTGAKLHQLVVAPSPDNTWSVALEEALEDDNDFEI
jgi:hypothetical protein